MGKSVPAGMRERAVTGKRCRPSGTPGRALPVRAARAARGFTVMELTLVLTVLVVAAGVVLPGLPAFTRGQRLRATAGRLAGMFRYALDWSGEHGREVVLSYEEADRQFRLALADPNAEPLLADPAPVQEQPQEAEEPALPESRSVLALPADVEAETAEVAGAEQPLGALAVRFLPDGRSDDARVVLRAGEARYTVLLDGRRRRVLVERGDVLAERLPVAAPVQ